MPAHFTDLFAFCRRALEVAARMGDMPPQRRVASTADPYLDQALGGGLPVGITEVCGAQGAGKTTLALRLAAALGQLGLPVLWFEADCTATPAMARQAGLPAAARFCYPQDVLQGLDMAAQAMALVPHLCVVIDSLGVFSADEHKAMQAGLERLLRQTARRDGRALVVHPHVHDGGGLRPAWGMVGQHCVARLRVSAKPDTGSAAAVHVDKAPAGAPRPPHNGDCGPGRWEIMRRPLDP